MKALVTYREASEMLSVSHWTVRQWVREGRLNVTGEGKGRRVTMGSILRLGELDTTAFEGNSHTVSSVQQQERDAPYHAQGNAHSTGLKRTASQASKELDELLGKKHT